MSNQDFIAIPTYVWELLGTGLPGGSYNHCCVDSQGNVYVAVNALLEQACFLVKAKAGATEWETVGGSFSGMFNAICVDNKDNVYLAGTVVDENNNPQIICHTNDGQWQYYPSKHNTLTMRGILGFCCNAENRLYVAGNVAEADGNYYIYEYDLYTQDWKQSGKGFEYPLNWIKTNEKGCMLTIGADTEGIPFAALGFADTDWYYLKVPKNLVLGTSISTDSKNNFFVDLTDGNNAYIGVALISSMYENDQLSLSVDFNVLPSSIPLNGGTGIYSIYIDQETNIYAAGDFADQFGYCYVAMSNDKGQKWENIGGSTTQCPIEVGANCIKSLAAIPGSSPEQLLISGRFDFVSLGQPG